MKLSMVRVYPKLYTKNKPKCLKLDKYTQTFVFAIKSY